MTATQADTDGGLNLSFAADIRASLGTIAATAEKTMEWYRRRDALFQRMHQVPITPGQIALTAGAGILQSVEQLQPKTGLCWSIRRLVAVGFTAGTVTAYLDPVVSGTVITGESLVPWTQAGVFTFGRGELLLMPGDFIAFAASGISGSVTIYGRADQFETWLLPDYLM